MNKPRPPVELPPCRQCGSVLTPDTVELTCAGAYCRVCGVRDPVGGMLGRDQQLAALRERMAQAERLLFSRGGMSNPTHREQAVDAARALLAQPAATASADREGQ